VNSGIESDVPLAEWCTLGVGGAARWFCEAGNEGAVIEALAWAQERGVRVHILGGGSNVVFGDEGFDGLVLRVNVRGVVSNESNGRIIFRAGAGEVWDPLVAMAVEADCAGLECLSGIPGQVGGTPIQNVGAYGQEVSDVITSVRVVDRHTHAVVTLSNAECLFGYRTSRFKGADHDRFVVTHVEFSLARAGPPTVTYADVVAYFQAAGNRSPSLHQVRQAILLIRGRKGMVIESGNPANRSVGSFFVNPVVTREHFARLLADATSMPHYIVGDNAVKIPAAWLIERAGFAKGFKRGEVAVSPFQAQAIINLGGATAADVLHLASDIKHAVWKRFDITLKPEPVFVGFPPSPELNWLLESDRR
jgi:UDP-N-acetylmuramate dehydrogenase